MLSRFKESVSGVVLTNDFPLNTNLVNRYEDRFEGFTFTLPKQFCGTQDSIEVDVNKLNKYIIVDFNVGGVVRKFKKEFTTASDLRRCYRQQLPLCNTYNSPEKIKHLGFEEV